MSVVKLDTLIADKLDPLWAAVMGLSNREVRKIDGASKTDSINSSGGRTFSKRNMTKDLFKRQESAEQICILLPTAAL